MCDSGVHALHTERKGRGQVVKSLIAELSERLRPITESPEHEAAIILEQVYGRDFRLKLLLGKLDREPTLNERERLGEMVARRISGEPLQYIIGEWEFYGLELKVGEGVLIPRADTETLVDTALRLVRSTEKPKILDLCSGTGCVALAIKSKRTDAEVSALELYPEAFKILRENIARYGGVHAVNADALSEDIAANFRDLDLITANPPYLTSEDMSNLQREVTKEPATALFGGKDGLDFYRGLSRIWRTVLRDGGHIAFEIGFGQENDVIDILRSQGYKNIGAERDLTGKVRVVYAEK